MSSGINRSEIRAGAHRVLFTPSGGSETELGLTTEGFIVRIERGTFLIQTEEDGDAPSDLIELGELVTARGILRQFDNTQLLIAVPGSTESAGPTIKAWQFGKQPGSQATLTTGRTGRLRLHPITNPTLSDESDDIIFHKAAVLGEPIEIPLRNRAVREVAIAFVALVDDTKSDGNRLGRWKLQTV